MKHLHAFDLVVLAYLAVVTGIVSVSRPKGLWIYLVFHFLAVVLLALVVFAERRYGGRFWGILRHWYVVPVILALFREIHFLMPEVHPFEDGRYDRALAWLDVRLFGDVDSAMMSLAWPPFVDLLHLCYWSYFGLLLAPGIALHLQNEMDKFRECIAIVLCAMFVSYLGYFIVPAVGPHHFFPTRPAELDGWEIGGILHQALMAAEGDMPDAFPSGHVLASLAALSMAWRHCRSVFWAMLFPTVGCILATVVLRYHYVVDVLASFALWPMILVSRPWLCRMKV